MQVGFDGMGFDENVVCRCESAEDGAFLEEDRSFGEEDSDVMLKDVKIVDGKVGKGIR